MTDDVVGGEEKAFVARPGSDIYELFNRVSILEKKVEAEASQLSKVVALEKSVAALGNKLDQVLDALSDAAAILSEAAG